MSINFKTLLAILCLLFLLPLSTISQSSVEMFHYISPQPGSINILPGNNIALRQGEPFDENVLQKFKLFVKDGSANPVTGQLTLSDDRRTILFLPDKPFQRGARIYVRSTGFIKTINNIEVMPVSFYFDVIKALPELPTDYFTNKELQEINMQGVGQKPAAVPLAKSVNENYLPEDFPELNINFSSIDAEAEYYFISPFGYWGWFPDNTPYLIIMDHTGTPVFYQKLLSHPYDFKVQQNGSLSFFYNLWPNPILPVLDSSYQMIDTYTMGNGYGRCDFHEFQLLPNGHAIVMCYYPIIIDMSQIVPGGYENATVSDWIIQELDASKNVVFQWRALDHFQMTDADEYVDLTDSIIDPTHGNAIEVLDDNAFLLSTRNFNEITKIDRNTGDILWRMGGENNMFEFLNDTLRFSRAHDIRKMDNGHISLFDNGTYHPEPQFSSVIEYEVDETNYTVSLIRRLRSQPDIFGSIMGSAQETSNQHMVAGWGSGVPGLTEFDENNEICLEVYFAGINYRAYRFPWKTNYFKTNKDTLFYGYIWQEDSLAMPVSVMNTRDHEIEITSAYNMTSNFQVLGAFPVAIPAGETTEFWIKFKPDSVGEFRDVITLNSDINNDTLVRRIAQQVTVWGYATEGQSVEENLKNKVKIFPNPVKDQLVIEVVQNLPSSAYEVIGNTGSKIISGQISNQGKITLNTRSWAAGLYMIRITVGGKQELNYKVIKK